MNNKPLNKIEVKDKNLLKQIFITLILFAILINFFAFAISYNAVVRNNGQRYFLVTKNHFINEFHYGMLFWSHWEIFFVSIVSAILIITETKLFFSNHNLTKITEKQRSRYIFLRSSALSYGMFTFLFYNGVLIMWLSGGPNWMADDPLSIASMSEHSVTPILFLIYFIMTYKKSFVQNKYNIKLYLKFIMKLCIVPYMYLIFIAMNEAFVNNSQYWYPYPQFSPLGHGFIHFMEILIIIPIIMMIINLYIIITNSKYLFNYHKKTFIINKLEKSEV